MYEYVDHVLANYLNSELGFSEEDAIAALRAHLSASAELEIGFRSDLEKALLDEDFSWKEAFSKNEVIVFENEASARGYAQSLLWDSLFEIRGDVGS